jgi:ABC-type Na+ efflux pump permease subunit
MITWTLAAKDLRLLLRDRRAVIILIVMPLVFILVLGLSLGQGFGQKSDDRLRISLADLDEGFPPEPQAIRDVRLPVALLSAAPGPFAGLAAVPFSDQAAAGGAPEPWSKMVRRDLEQTAGIRLEIVPTRAEAEALVRDRKRAAVLVFGPQFSRRIAECSFLGGGLNPFYRDGVNLKTLDATFLHDEPATPASAIIEQVAQVTLLRVVLPWMIGRAFDRLSDPAFIKILGEQVQLPVPGVIALLVGAERQEDGTYRAPLRALIQAASAGSERREAEYKAKVGEGVQKALAVQFSKYNLQGKTWAALTKSEEPGSIPLAETGPDDAGSGLLRRGAYRYQLLVPSYTVMFAFFLVLTVGWLFVGERRQGTLKRLRAAPLSRGQILAGKMAPCFVVSWGQGLTLLLAGRLVFGMNWGPDPAWLLLVVLCTSTAAVGMALLVAAAARTETQVAIYGTLLMLVLAGVSGCLMPRSLMSDEMKQISLLTPHAWALDAYAELLTRTEPNLAIVTTACLVLTAFGAAFAGLAWWALNLETA